MTEVCAISGSPLPSSIIFLMNLRSGSSVEGLGVVVEGLVLSERGALARASHAPLTARVSRAKPHFDHNLRTRSRNWKQQHPPSKKKKTAGDGGAHVLGVAVVELVGEAPLVEREVRPRLQTPVHLPENLCAHPRSSDVVCRNIPGRLRTGTGVYRWSV